MRAEKTVDRMREYQTLRAGEKGFYWIQREEPKDQKLRNLEVRGGQQCCKIHTEKWPLELAVQGIMRVIESIVSESRARAVSY